MQARNEDTHSGLTRTPYLHVLRRARGTSRRILDRLRTLSGTFPDALPPRALEGLERATAEGSLDRRHSLRLTDCPTWVQVCLAPPPAVAIRAPLRDHSACGLGLYLERPLAVGTPLWVRLEDDSAEAAEWTVLEVRHCRRAAHGWLVGCELLRLPDEKGGPSD